MDSAVLVLFRKIEKETEPFSLSHTKHSKYDCRNAYHMNGDIATEKTPINIASRKS